MGTDALRLRDDPPRNHLRWLTNWRPEVEQAMAWACAQFPADLQARGIARGYYETLRVINETLRECSQGFAGLRIADVGCGAGVYALALSKLGARVTAIDEFAAYETEFDNQMGSVHDIVPRLERNGIEVVRRNIVTDGLPPEEGQYDVVLFLHVIEHLHQSPHDVLAGLRRMLRPGGIVVVTTPNHAWLRTRVRLLTGRSAYHPLAEWWKTPFYGHVREYTMPELTQLLRWSGFQLCSTSISNWSHVPSRCRSRNGAPDTWTTRLTLDSPERWVVASSLLLTSLFSTLRYSMLAIGRKVDTGTPQ